MELDDQRRQHEVAVIEAFVMRNRQERSLSLLANPNKRWKVTRELGHFKWFDRRFVTPIAWQGDPRLKLSDRYSQGRANTSRQLRLHGAGQTCWVISDDTDLDGWILGLDKALDEIIGRGQGTILSCLPGQLAYFEGEDESLLLTKSR